MNIKVTLAQEHIIEKILNYFGTNSKFMIRFQKCDLTAKDFVIPVFAVIITKFKTALSQKRVSTLLCDYYKYSIMNPYRDVAS